MDALSDALGAEVHGRQVSGGVEIAHLKVSVVEASSVGECALSVVQCVSSGAGPQAVRRSATQARQAVEYTGISLEPRRSA